MIAEMQQSQLEMHGQNKKAPHIDVVYEELCFLRQSNRKMEKRIHLLERQNISLAQNAHHIGSNEPARPYFSKKKTDVNVL